MRPTLRRAGRQLVLARVRGELAQDLAGPQGPGGHGGRDAQDVRPVPVDQVDVHLAADQRAQEASGRPRGRTRRGGADHENRETAVVRQLAKPVGEVALPLPAQPA